MKLYLMRHGQAAMKVMDPEQGLTQEGAADIKRLAQQLKQQGIRFQQVIHSEKTRSRQTAEIMAAEIAPEVTLALHDNIKPNDDPQALLAEMDDWQDDTLVVSHLPFAPTLLGLLSGHLGATDAVEFYPGTVVCVSRLADGDWQFEWVATP
jgi:phosphohistidine phosphatase